MKKIINYQNQQIQRLATAKQKQFSRPMAASKVIRKI